MPRGVAHKVVTLHEVEGSWLLLPQLASAGQDWGTLEGQGGRQAHLVCMGFLPPSRDKSAGWHLNLSRVGYRKQSPQAWLRCTSNHLSGIHPFLSHSQLGRSLVPRTYWYSVHSWNTETQELR